MTQFVKNSIKVGDIVKWYDPAVEDYDFEDKPEVYNRTFSVDSVNKDAETAVISEVDGGSEAEVYLAELLKVQDDLTVHHHSGWTTSCYTLVFGYKGSLFYIEYANDDDSNNEDWWSEIFDYYPYEEESIGEPATDIPDEIVELVKAKAKELSQAL